MNKKKPDLSISFCGKRFINPFLLSSSPVSNSAEMVERSYEAGWGGVAYKTLVSDRIPITHPSPRMHPYHCGEKKLVGLQNVEQTTDRGLKPNLRDISYLKKRWPDRIILASIMGFSNDEWAELAKACDAAGADMLELNFSCPHMAVEGSGCKVGQEHELVEKFTATVRKVTRLPLVAKMTPNLADMSVPALAAKAGGADAICAINTVKGISEIGLDDWVPKPNVFGKGAISGYSGPAIKPIGLRFIAELAMDKRLGLPLSGVGGIETWGDCLEYILAGASTVQVTTGVIHYGYRIVEDMIEGLSDYMAGRGIASVEELVGKAVGRVHDTGRFDVKRQGSARFDLERCVGCGQCYIVCRDAGGFALEWDAAKRRPRQEQDKCLSCMVCSFVCPVDGLISFEEMPSGWKRRPTVTLG
ncbi:MAG: NAD-dependent dihydropyrimidine dehydrogenase subunit PreA [Elusimicrobia bacterium]|nr:NAD-dependent dihydropyrimidine dehydrogenase subunit PreA [Elusimicrobiota bacterium]